MQESQIQRQIIDFLKAHPAVAVVGRTNAVRRGGAHLLDAGWTDITGMLHGGVFFAIEVKRPGQKPEPHQRDWLEGVAASGGAVCVARSVDDVATWIDVVKVRTRGVCDRLVDA